MFVNDESIWIQPRLWLISSRLAFPSTPQISIDARTEEARKKTTKRIEYLQQCFEHHSEENPIKLLKPESRETLSATMMHQLEHKYAANWFTQFWLMTWRTWLCMRRNKMDNIIRFFQVRRRRGDGRGWSACVWVDSM